MQITTIGLDFAKNVFQVHGIDAAEKVVVRKQLRRGQVIAFFAALPPCLIGMEACATAHYWAPELTKLGLEVRLMPAKDVKAYVKRNKNDAADAEAICEAVGRGVGGFPFFFVPRGGWSAAPLRPLLRQRTVATRLHLNERLIDNLTPRCDLSGHLLQTAAP
jgi:Transposase